MKKLAPTAFAAAILVSLSACSNTDSAMTGDETAMEDTATAQAAAPEAQPSDSTSVSVGKNGVNADVHDGDTSVSVDTKDGVSASVDTD